MFSPERVPAANLTTENLFRSRPLRLDRRPMTLLTRLVNGIALPRRRECPSAAERVSSFSTELCTEWRKKRVSLFFFLSCFA